eukprot:scaffold26788_cov58-Phaeocystis_antarctica.AAC.2
MIHVRDFGGVEAQWLVEVSHELPSRKDAGRGASRETGGACEVRAACQGRARLQIRGRVRAGAHLRHVARGCEGR